ncbi:MAG: ABC transporter ATP-binding protein [Pseudomonadota bacterium]
MTPLLSIAGLSAGYGAGQVLFDIGFDVGEGEAVTLLGRNGMGKTSTIRAVMGLLPAWNGEVRIAGKVMTRAPPYRIAQAGLGLVPEGRQIFTTLTVEENLMATAAARSGPARWRLADVFTFFPRLEERRRSPGARLSGGEQQMLAIGRALMTNPRLLILDEATEGLAPMIRAEIWGRLGALKDRGQAILMVDKDLDAMARIADRHVVLEKGHVVWRGNAEALRADRAVVDRHLHL